MSVHPTLQRLDDQIAWYDGRSQKAQRAFKALKLASVVCALAVPIVALSELPVFAAVLGALIAFAEILQQLNQYHANWITYRSTCEALKHEKYLHLANAGPYADPATALAVLADRIESLISQEHAKWIATANEAGKTALSNARGS